MRLPAIAIAAALCAGSAHASGTISCTSPEMDEVSAELTIGSLPVLAIVAARITTPASAFSIAEDAGTPIRVGQAFSDADGMSVDFTDPNLERVLVRLRLVSAEEGKDFATAGLVSVAGEGVWPITCVGP